MKQDVAMIYESKTKVSSAVQGYLFVTEYYNYSNGLWLEIDHYQDLKMKCAEDEVLLEFLERERIFRFLAGLNMEYGQVREQVLGKDRLPSLSEVLSVRVQETQLTEGSAMMSKKGADGGGNKLYNPGQGQNKADSSKQSNRDGLWCSNCKKPRHTRENCFNLHGKAQVLARNGGFKGHKQTQAYFSRETCC